MTTSFPEAFRKQWRRGWPWLVAAIAILGWMLFMSIDSAGQSPDGRPTGSAEDIVGLADRDDVNVLFILIDTLRADRLGAYGYERDTSPTLDRLSESGVRFARHLSQSSWTKASMASMWTSLHPPRTGVTRFDHVIPDEAVMPAETLQSAGFRTIGLYRNGWVAPTFGFQQGFDVYTRPAHRKRDQTVIAANPTIRGGSTDEDAIAEAIEFLRVSGEDQRWFLYLHLMDVHEYLYDEASAIFGGQYSDKYDSSIRWVDGTLEILFEYLAEWDLDQNTLVVIAVDHGEAFRERGIEGHARAVYRETTEIPWLLSFPFRLEPGLVVPTRTQNIDIWPTLFDLLGIDAPTSTDGRSRMPEILAAARGESLGEDHEDTIGFAHLDTTWGKRDRATRDRVAITEGAYRYLSSELSGSGSRVLEELFDAERDPRELDDRAEEEPEVLERLREMARARLEEKPPWNAAPNRELDEFELNQLRALGYSIPK